MHAHGVEVFNGAHDNAVSCFIAHDFHLVFFPALDAFFHQHFAGRGKLQALAYNQVQLFAVVRNAAARAAQREAGAQHNGITQTRGAFHNGARVFQRVSVLAARCFNAQFRHALLE